MNARSDFRGLFEAQISCHCGASPPTMVSFKSREESHADQKTCLCHVRGSGCSCIRDRFGWAKGSSQEEESSSSGGGATGSGGAVADVLGSPLRTGLREEGRHELQLHQRLLRDEGSGEGCQAGRMQGSKGWREEEEGISHNSNRAKVRGPLRCRGPLHFTRPVADYFLRGGICSNSVTWSWVNGLSRNFNFTASAIAPSRSANFSGCIVSLGWNFSIDSLSIATGCFIFLEYIC